METKAYAVMWNSTNNRGIPRLPKLCTVLKLISEDTQTAVEIAAFKIAELIMEQFPSFRCEIINAPEEPYCIAIEIYEDKEFVGKVYGFNVLE